MLNDQRAIEIISKARQKNVASPKRTDRDFARIFEDFFEAHDFKGEAVLELGPGQYEFARRVRERGGLLHCIDNDPAVLELGRYFNFDVTSANLSAFDNSPFQARFDGLFCKFSINAFWFDTADEHTAFIDDLNATLRPDGWGWVAPWNGIGKRDPDSPFVCEMLQRQTAAFVERGWSAFDLNPELAGYYGMNGAVVNHAIFVKNLPVPAKVNTLRVKLASLKARVTNLFLR
jgi:hypothetical protein